MNKSNAVHFPWRYDFRAFEDKLVPKVNEFVKAHRNLVHKTFEFNLTQTTRADLMELGCLLIAADYIRAETGCDCEFEFLAPEEVRVGLEFLNKLMSERHLSKDKKDLLADLIEKEKDFLRRRIEFARFLVKIGFFSLLREKRLKANVDAQTYRGVQLTFFPQVPSELCLRLSSFRSWKDLTNAGGISEQLDSQLVSRLRLPEVQRTNLSEFIVGSLCDNALQHAYDAAEAKCAMISVRRIGRIDRAKDVRLRLSNAPDWLKDFLDFHKNHNLVEIVVIDGGKGIHKSLGRAFHDRKGYEGSELEVVEWSFESGSSRFQRQGTDTKSKVETSVGWGLWDVRNFTKAWEGLIYARTGKVRIIYFPMELGREPDRCSDIGFFPGTQYRIILPQKEVVKKIADIKKRRDLLMEESAND